MVSIVEKGTKQKNLNMPVNFLAAFEKFAERTRIGQGDAAAAALLRFMRISPAEREEWMAELSAFEGDAGVAGKIDPGPRLREAAATDPDHEDHAAKNRGRRPPR